MMQPMTTRFAVERSRNAARQALAPIEAKSSVLQNHAAVMIQRMFRRVRARGTLQEVFKRDRMRALRRREMIAAKVRDICIYVLFLLCFTTSSVVILQEQDIFNMGHHITEQVAQKEFRSEHSHVPKTFEDVATWEEFYQWAQGPLYDTIYTGAAWQGGPTNPMSGYLFANNRIVGSIRFGTLRAKERDCFNLNFKILNATATQPMRCWGDSNGDFSLATEETAPYGTGPDKFTWNGTGTEPAAGPTAVADERSVLGSSYRTGHERVYATPAYWVLLPNHDADQALHNILYMKDHGYVDEQTRAVFVDFTVYNPMMNYWSIFRFVAESPKAGGMLMSHQLTTVRLYSVFESEILHWLVLEIIVICFFLYFILEQVPKIRQEGRAYLKQMSTMAHNANIIAYLLVWGFRFGAIAMLPPQDEIALDSDVFYQFRMASVYKSLSVYFNSLNAFLCWFKLVRYLSYIPRFALVTGTLVKSARGVSGFAVVFCVVFYGFAAAHMMTFGGRVHGYRNLTSSVYTLLKSLLGEFNLDEMTRAQWFMGPLFFVLFIALAVFVVLNVLIAIISDAYAEQSAELKESVDTEMGRDIVKYIHSVVLQTPCGRGARLGAQSLDKSRRIMVSKMSSRAGWEGELTARNKSHVSRSATVSPSGVGAVRATPTTAATAWAASEHKGDQRDVPESADGRSQPVDVEAKAAVTLPAL